MFPDEEEPTQPQGFKIPLYQAWLRGFDSFSDPERMQLLDLLDLWRDATQKQRETWLDLLQQMTKRTRPEDIR